MGYLLLAVVVLLVLVVLPMILKTFTDLDTKGQIIIVSIVLFIIIFSGIYTYTQDSNNEDNLKKILAFNEGKTLICKEREVDKEHFNFINGTLSFMAKDPNMRAGLVIELNDCAIKDSK